MRHIFLIILLLSCKAFSATYYVDAAAGGGGDGQSATPWTWAEFKASAAQGGDVVNLRGAFGVESGYLSTDPIGSVGDGYLVLQQWSGEATAVFNEFVFSTAVSVDGYIEFNGITFTGTAKSYASTTTVFSLGNFSRTTFDGCTMTGDYVSGTNLNNGDFAPYYRENSNFLATPSGTSHYITIQNCDISQFHNGLRNITGNNWDINNNTFHTFADNAIQFSGTGGSNTNIYDNTFHGYSAKCGVYKMSGTWSEGEPAEGAYITQATTGASGIYKYLEDGEYHFYLDDVNNVVVGRSHVDYNWTVDGSSPTNTLTVDGGGDNTHSDAISFEMGESNINVYENEVYDTGFTAQGFKIGSGNPSNVSYYNNVLYHTNSVESGNYLLYCETGTNLKYYNNTVYTPYGNKNRGIRVFAGVTSVDVWNNIFSGAVYASQPDNRVYNLYVEADPGSLGTGEVASGLAWADIVTDAANGDFTLRATDTDAIDSGTDTVNSTSAPSVDIAGVSRPQNTDFDIGAYEYASGATAPTVTSPTSASVGTTTATLGANVTSNGGAALTANGTVWGTSPNPTGNALDEGSHTTGVFTHARTGLPAGTLIYYRGYATNSEGTAYSADDTFTTNSESTPKYLIGR
jgi:hypothetical protein